MRYKIRTKVADVKIVGAVWYVRFEGSWEFLKLDDVKPAFEIGDKFRIILEKDNAEPSESPVE